MDRNRQTPHSPQNFFQTASSWLSRHLTLLVFIALVAAVLLGQFGPATAIRMKFLGDDFIAIIKVFIPFIIFLTIVSGISGMSDLKKVGRIGVKALVYFEVVTTLSLTIGILLAYLVKPGHVDKKSLPAGDASQYAKVSGFDWGAFFVHNITLQVLILAIIAGIILSLHPKRRHVLPYIHHATRRVFQLLKYFMFLAPLGAFGGMAYTIGKYGIGTLKPLAMLMGTVYGTMIIFIFVVLGGIMRYFNFNIWTYLKDIREEILIVLGTSSSEAAQPSLMAKLERMGCSQPVVGLVIPTGYSFNLDGTSIYLSMSVIFLAQLYDVHLSLGELLSILGILMITSKGAAGVTGSGFTVLASTLTALQKIPVEGLAFLLAVDKFMSEARAITNIIGNGVATLVIAKSEGEFNPATAAESPGAATAA
ncbi:MAG TPA: cation:dicarboxylase symporter family transporter [Puia sp.]|jgi:aerobic C4-dicarboxylate transport protein|nr:cation:dicarboxylase symporter family transporter [Puia sp.]